MDASEALPIIPLHDLKRNTRALSAELRDAIQQVMAIGWYVLGPQIEKFEATFADYCGVRHCVTVANGTDALEIALRALGCGAGDEVVTVANCGMYSSAAIVAIGARPIFADINAATLTMDPVSLQTCLGPKTRAIIVTHLYGHIADMDGLTAVADANGLPIIEDCAQAHGAERNGRKAGAWGTIGCFSFYPTKDSARSATAARLLQITRHTRPKRAPFGNMAGSRNTSRNGRTGATAGLTKFKRRSCLPNCLTLIAGMHAGDPSSNGIEPQLAMLWACRIVRGATTSRIFVW